MNLGVPRSDKLLSSDRFALLEEACARWSGPMLFVVAYREDDITSEFGTSSTCARANVRYLQHYLESNDVPYPINFLRNVAVNAVHTSHYILLDVDFVPSNDLYESLVQESH